VGAPRWEDFDDGETRSPGRRLGVTGGDPEDAAPPWSADEAGEAHIRGPRQAGGLDDALACCYRHLARREHSVAELRARLARERLAPQAIEEALATVIEQGYLDDARYARLMVEDRRAIDGWGAERIRARLEAAGIDRELIDEVLGDVDAASELAAATAVLRGRCELPLVGDRQRRRALAILLQRGFDSEVAYDAVRACGACGASADA